MVFKTCVETVCFFGYAETFTNKHIHICLTHEGTQHVYAVLSSRLIYSFIPCHDDNTAEHSWGT